MKILAIRGENLASLEEPFDIDFTQEPLASTGLFAITGMTGSGKSTILDALCLALYERTPRMASAKSSDAIKDVDDTTISPTNAASVLRRGAVSCFAEVDFLALNGNRYRSRWSISRAYNKPSGRLRNSTIQVLNIDTDEEEQGTKTELLNRLVELIGLSFDQFRRTVLLAQGEFATFLKADSNEKAELLEKLTGTEIYSELSRLIYARAKNAKMALEEVNRRIGDIQLMSEEERQEKEGKKEENRQRIAEIDIAQKILSKKTEWIKTEQSLKEKRDTARLQSDKAITENKNAEERRAFLTKIDEAQDVREHYSKQIEALNRQTEVKNLLTQQQNELDAITIQEKEAGDKVVSAKNEQEKHAETMRKNDSLLKEARKLDMELQQTEKRKLQIEKEGIELKKKFDESDVLLKKAEKELQTVETSFNNSAAWLKENTSSQPIAESADTLIYRINDYEENIALLEAKRHTIETERNLLESSNKRLKELEEEKERLNQLLPSEVLLLRAKLVSGEPCPVCGSVHHDLDALQQQTDDVQAAELDNQKQLVENELMRVQKEIETQKTTISKAESAAEAYQTNSSTLTNILKGSLQALPDWESLMKQQKLIPHIENLAKEWKNHNENIQTLNPEIARLKTGIENSVHQLKEQEVALKQKREDYQSAKNEYNELTINRNKLFDGKSADEVEQELKETGEKLQKNHENAQETWNNLKQRGEKTRGSILSLKKQLKSETETIATLQNTITNWLQAKNRSFEELETYMKKSGEWISNERKELESLASAQQSAKKLFEERQAEYDLHQKTEGKPDEKETLEQLKETEQELKNEQLTKQKENTTIEIAFQQEEDKKKKLHKFETEREQKTEVSDNWAKLDAMFGSSNGDKFKRLAQGYTLDWLLSHANVHLETLSPRYRLERVNDEGLGLQVVDTDMLNETRSVNSLSGGESFLVSLALALGLSSLSSDRMSIESLFIDEGFGSLDTDTLHTAMNALEALQMQGRKIGVISHVAEMTEAIPVQITVRRASKGKSVVEIIST